MSFTRSVQFAFALAASLASAASLPCDIYASGNTPCVAAHSTTRALYNAFNGALYQATRNSDGAMLDIHPLSAGGVANAAAQDSFCAGETCSITIIYDQSPQGNHISRALGGYWAGPQADKSDDAASAVGAPVTLNGVKAYGVFVSPGTGYRNNNAKNTAIGDAAQGTYAVFDGTHSNDQCCFDYGNAETSGTDTGDGHMQALYFGSCTIWGSGAGTTGPWLMADLENGLFAGQSLSKASADPAISNRFFTAILKGESNQWALRGGNAASGSLSTYYSGARPSGWNPMHQEGAIVLGIGGDNSNGAQGTFYEGAMTSGYPSDATENAVQANIVTAGYAPGQLNSGPSLTLNSPVTFHVTTPGYNTRYLAHSDSTINTQVISSSSPTSLQNQGTWTVRTGLGNSACYSFESVDTPGSYIRHSNFQLQLQASDGSKQFGEDTTFCTQTGLTGSGTTSIRAWGFPSKYFRHYTNVGYIASQGGPHAFDSKTSYENDVSFIVGKGFSS